MILPHILDFIGYRSLELSHRLKGHQIHPDISTKRYVEDDPFELLRITYPLDATSQVVDLGGFRGEWAQQIYCRYHSNIDIYEPHPALAAAIRYHFLGENPGVRVFQIALSDKNTTMDLHGDDIYASLYESSGKLTSVAVRKTSEVFNERYSGKTIGLLKINIEGSEYEVLPDLIKNYDMRSIENIQIQFHNMVPGYAMKRKAIRFDLEETHTCDWCYDYLYESWSLDK